MITTRVKGNGRVSAPSSLMPPLRIMTQFGDSESQAEFNHFPSKLRYTSKGPSHQQRAYHRQSACHQQRAVPPAKGRAANKGPCRQQIKGPCRQQNDPHPPKGRFASKGPSGQQNDFPPANARTSPANRLPTSRRVPGMTLATINTSVILASPISLKRAGSANQNICNATKVFLPHA